eukprot:m.460590 g.460590  ORF g.460590 m.460590 type:complete len:86 (+) comp22072_c0_seq1:174-431(+)
MMETSYIQSLTRLDETKSYWWHTALRTRTRSKEVAAVRTVSFNNVNLTANGAGALGCCDCTDPIVPLIMSRNAKPKARRFARVKN